MSKEGQGQFVDRTVRDLMIPLDSYPHIDEATTLEGAIAIITGAQIERQGKLSLPRVVLVIDEDGRLVGLLRRRDIMRGLLPEFLVKGEKHAESHYDFDMGTDLQLADLFKDESHKILTKEAEASVKSVMQPFDDTIDADADLIELIRKMVLSEFHFLPVTEGENVVGVVRTVEILNELHELLGG